MCLHFNTNLIVVTLISSLDIGATTFEKESQSASERENESE